MYVDIEYVNKIIKQILNDKYVDDFKYMLKQNAVTSEEILETMTDDERLELFSRYCKYCGQDLNDTSSGICFCMNDE